MACFSDFSLFVCNTFHPFRYVSSDLHPCLSPYLSVNLHFYLWVVLLLACISMYKSVIHPFLYLYLDVHFCYGTDNQDLTCSCFARKAHIIIDEIVVARTSLVVEHLFSDLCLHQAFLPVVNSTHPTFSHSYHHILSTRGLLLHSFWQGAASFHLRPAGTALIWD